MGRRLGRKQPLFRSRFHVAEVDSTMSRNPTLREGAAIEHVVSDDFAENPRAMDLIGEFLRRRHAYHRDFVESLLALARSPTAGEPELSPVLAWEIRCLAALMLQQQFLRLPAREANESLAFLGLIGLLSGEGSEPQVTDAVLKEGYTTTRPVAFLRQFRRQLRRLDRVLSPVSRGRVTRWAIQDFIAIARWESCKLCLARHLFDPDDVAERIRGQVRRSSGESAAFTYVYADDESRRTLSNIPIFEAGLLRALCRNSETFWVATDTSSRLNALIEQPINTVVLTVKPPGSSLEIEIKRAGHRSDLPLTIIHDRDGRPVPPSHRLNGGSSADMLQWEAGNSACLARIYWLVHRSPPPISITTAIAYPNTLPVGDGSCQHLIDYFSDPNVFGDDFPRMRRAMSQSVASFAKERGQGLSELQGKWADTLRFFEYAVPAQSMLVGSTSFRLQQLSRYLSSDGVRQYFGDGTGPHVPSPEARRFADALLEEVLGLYKPPNEPYEAHESYLDAAFSRPENRARADRVHASLTRQLGTFWATVLALRIYSHGESFVARNVGLKTVWERGRWTVRIIFMDHDNVTIPTRAGVLYHPAKILPGTITDEFHVIGYNSKSEYLVGAIEHLRFIYRIDDKTAERHWLLFRDSMARAYHKTRHKLATSPGLKRILPREFISSSHAWDCAVAIFLRRSESKSASNWSIEADAAMERRGLPADYRERYLSGVEEYAPFLERHAYLYTAEPP
jgi:hypothetical protein